ncbi:MAG: DUF4249 domain-containing protein [Sphingobacteriales bacterium]
MHARGLIVMMSVSVIMVAESCKKTYKPSVVASNANYLVVEGAINSGADSTFIKLSRTVNLSDKITSKPDSEALVTVENDQQTSFQLQETLKGTYALPPMTLDTAHKYRVRIKTADGKEYLSDFVRVYNSPPIDTLRYQVKGDGLHIYVSTHDNTNKIHYYKWDYDETWAFNSHFESFLRYVNGQFIYRTADQQIYHCWGNDHSTVSNLETTNKLSQSVINDKELVILPLNSEKLSIRYSILVKEYGLPLAAYEYFTNLKKNTEQIGTIFDAEPSELKGNITCVTNPAIPVIGFITAGTVTSKRIFIDNRDLPPVLPYTYYDMIDCKDDVVKVSSEADIERFYGGVHPEFIPLGDAAQAGASECVDCTLRGTNKQPAFWR